MIQIARYFNPVNNLEAVIYESLASEFVTIVYRDLDADAEVARQSINSLVKAVRSAESFIYERPI
jgi:hypothetical protein